MENTLKTDWLASRPVFYNEKTRKASHNINDVIDLDDLEFDGEGLFNYLNFGYSVLGKTPVRHVRFLRPCSEIGLDNGELRIVNHADTALAELDRHRLPEDDIIDMMRQKVNGWCGEADTVIVPTSGGFDSRLLNWLIADRSKARAFSYAASERHPEAVKAAALCRKLGIRWEYVPLGRFHNYIDEWDRMFGAATHSHGMYQMEFYHLIGQDQSLATQPVLSGIVGDLWAGSIAPRKPESPADILELGYTHGLAADGRQSLLPHGNEAAEAFFERMRGELADMRARVLETVRIKMILLNYLVRVPEAQGHTTWSPFLDADVALAMLNLPQERRQNRLWQRELFSRQGLDLEHEHLRENRCGHIVINGMRQVALRPLRKDLLREVVREDYVEWINRRLLDGSVFARLFDDIMFTPYIKEALRRMGVRHERIEAYFAYLTLKPIENLLARREARAIGRAQYNKSEA